MDFKILDLVDQVVIEMFITRESLGPKVLVPFQHDNLEDCGSIMDVSSLFVDLA